MKNNLVKNMECNFSIFLKKRNTSLIWNSRKFDEDGDEGRGIYLEIDIKNICYWEIWSVVTGLEVNIEDRKYEIEFEANNILIFLKKLRQNGTDVILKMKRKTRITLLITTDAWKLVACLVTVVSTLGCESRWYICFARTSSRTLIKYLKILFLITILCSEVSSLLLLANWDFLSPEVQLQASSHNYKGIISIPYCKIKWFHLYSVIPIQS